MALTGAGVLIANSSGLGQNETQPRGLDSDGTYLYALGISQRRLIKITDLETFASEYASVQLPSSVNSLAFNDGSFYCAVSNTIHRIDPPFNATAGDTQLSVAITSGQFRSLCSDGTDLFGYDKQNSILYRIVDNGSDVTVVVFASVSFPVGITGNILSMFYLGNAFYLGNRYDGNLWKLPDNLTIGSLNVTPVRVGNFTNYDVSESRAAGAGVLGSDAYFLGDDTDALHRFYNVRWDETIDTVEVDAGGNGSLDLSTVSKDATSFEFAPSHTARSWLTISGMDLTVTNAPDVTADTDFEAVVRAVRGDEHEDKTLTVRVIAEAAPPPPLNPPTFTAPAANYEVNERASRTIDSTGFFTGHTSLVFRSGYSAPSWLTISGLNVVITDAPDVLEDTDFTVLLTATNSDSSVNGSITISVDQIDPAPVFGTPSRFDIDEGSSSVLDLSGDLQHTESLSYQSGYSAPSWLTISGLTLVITDAQQVSQDTDFDVLLAAESTKTAATADRTVTIRVRDVAVPPPPPPPMVTTPGAPTSLSLSSTHNSITANWGAPSNTGGENPSRYDIRIDGGAWIDTGLDLTRTFDSLSPNTEYTIDVAAVNSAGRGTPASSTITTDPAPIVVTAPGAPTSLTFTATHNSITANWGAVSDNGNGTITHYDIRIDGGAWIDTGLDGAHTFSNLSPDTEHTIDVAGVNSAGRGTPASGTERTGITAPGAPTNVSVDLKPTTAVIRWAAAVSDGGGIDEYEVSYQEGARPGTTWIATGSTGTRFFVRDLKRGTQYTFGVRGRNSAGAGAGSRPVTQNTPIASLHNALFFKEYVNSGNRVTVHGSPTDIVRAAVDNDYRTFSNATDYAIDMSRNNQPTRVDAVFIKSKGVTRHSGTPTGGSGTGWTNEALPATVKNWEGTHISTTVLGFQHHLLLMDQHFTATSVRVQFEGTNVEVYEILLLEFLLEIDANGDFTEIAPDYVDRSAVIHPSPGGGIQRSSSLGAERQKWETNYVVKIVPGKTLLESVDEFVYQMGENPNIVHAQEPSRYPARVHPASFLLKRVPTRLRSDDKLQGDAVQFRVGEQ